MLDIGWQELFVIAVVAIMFIGPKELPHVIRAVTRWMRKARELARDFQGGLDEVVREAELDDVKKEMQKVAAYDIEHEVRNTIDPSGGLSKDLDLTAVENDMRTSAAALVEKTDPGKPEPAPAAVAAGAEAAAPPKPPFYDSAVERPEPVPAGPPPEPAKTATGTSG